jgi:transcription antitermination factor NusG
MQWHVLSVFASRETAVAKRLGPAAYIPYRERWRPAMWGRPRRELEDTPLLSGYLFLGVPVASWADVLAVPDVLGVLLADGRPAVVRDAELAELRQVAKRAPIVPGQKVDVSLGPFAGQSLMVKAVDTPRRTITADIALLGSCRPVQISVDQLAA